MSNKNYGKFYNENKKNEVEEVETVEVPVEEIVESEVEVVETVESLIEEVEPVVEVKGVVVNCGKLNVRKQPDSNADVVTAIPVGIEVSIDMDASTKDYYKVNVGADIVGFCVKDYITIK